MVTENYPNWLAPHLGTCEAIVALFHPFAEVAVLDIRRDRIVALWNPISERVVGDASLLDELPEHPEDARVIGSYPKVLADGRQPVVISRNHSLASDRVRVAANVPDALALAQTLPGEIMICGGQRIYEETLPLADRLLLTLVHAEVPGDTYFPEWRHMLWRETWRRESHDANYRYTFLILDRAGKAAGR